jgi:hypothetical protein
MDSLVADSPLKRQSDIVQILRDLVPDQMAEIIGQYEYHLEGKCRTIESTRCHGLLSDGRLVCQKNGKDDIKILNIDLTENNCENLLAGDISMYHPIEKTMHRYLELPDNFIALLYYPGMILVYPLGERSNRWCMSFRDNGQIRCMEYMPDGLIVSGGQWAKNLGCDKP